MVAAVNRFWRTTLLTWVLLIALISSVFMLVGAVLDSATFGRHHLLIIGFNLVLLIILVILILGNLSALIYQRIKKKTGARLRMRLVGIFALLAVVPAIGIYSVSSWMLDRGMESWFSVGVEQALDDALSLSRYSLDTQVALQRSYLAPLVEDLNGAPDDLAVYLLNAHAREHPNSELVLFEADRKIIASAGSSAKLLPDLPSDDLLNQVGQRTPYYGVDPIQKRGLYVRLIVPVRGAADLREVRFLQVLYPFSARANTWAVSVQNTYQHYGELTYLRSALQNNFILVLTLVMLLGVFYAIWVAIVSARNLIRPIAELTDATHNIAQGDLKVRIKTRPKDELGQLVQSFNAMATHLSDAHNTNVHSKQMLEEQRDYLDTVLNNTLSGVLGLDENNILKKANPAASKILGIDWEQSIGQDFFAPSTQPIQQKFCDEIESNVREHLLEWEGRININVMGRYLALLCRGKILADGGQVIVFNDITQIEQAQRETVWGEVAKRLAHEIKNPLTPIQLSAEHLRNKLKGSLSEKELQFVNRSTHTIIEQVKAMRQLVDEFSQYSRPAETQFELLSLNTVVREVVDLYRGSHLQVQLHVPDEELYMLGSVSRLRQLLHNLLKNAEEAMHESGQREITVTVLKDPEDGRKIQLQVKDCGPGFAQDVMKNLFEPYATTKQKGKGLGLAIVKKIVEEHKGAIRVFNSAQGGAIVDVSFPCVEP